MPRRAYGFLATDKLSDGRFSELATSFESPDAEDGGSTRVAFVSTEYVYTEHEGRHISSGNEITCQVQTSSGSTRARYPVMCSRKPLLGT